MTIWHQSLGKSSLKASARKFTCEKTTASIVNCIWDYFFEELKLGMQENPFSVWVETIHLAMGGDPCTSQKFAHPPLHLETSSLEDSPHQIFNKPQPQLAIGLDNTNGNEQN